MSIQFTRATRAQVLEIPGLDGYRIDENGNVYSIRKARNGELRRLRPGLAGNGYLTVALHRKMFAIHSLMKMAFFHGHPPGLVMNHRDGNKLNNHLDNLELVTPSENNTHAIRMGLRGTTKLKGEQVATSKLTNQQVTEIKARLAGGEPCLGIATDFNVHRSTISKIKNNNNWKHV